MISTILKTCVILTTLHSTTSSKISESCQIYSDLTKQEFFADKSNLLYDFLSHERHNEYINAPSGFGKTTALHMLNCFLNVQLNDVLRAVPADQSHAHEIFKDLKISQHTNIVSNYMAQIPVINLNLSFSFEPTDVITHEMVLSQLNSNLKKCFQEYDWVPLESLNKSDNAFVVTALEGKLKKTQVERSLSLLNTLLRTNFKRRPILLIDEYDSLYNYLIQAGDQVQEGYNLINRMLENAIYQFANTSIDYTFMVGISSVPVFSAADLAIHVFHEEFTIAHRFVPYFGFTNDEMRTLFHKYNCSDEEKENITRNYGNYAIRNGSLYITNSIAQYFKNRDPADTSMKLYWKHTKAINLFFFFYDVPSFTKRIFDILAGEAPVKLQIDTSSVTFKALRYLASNITNSTDESDDHILHPLLLEQGYLTRTEDRDMYLLPNLEAYHSLNNNILNYYSKRMNDTQHLRQYIPKI
ncbi:uncharacterized protein LOC135844497 [Planococcus citri]|uniref:uncharacterized protein LOC135844497 n=1 Tax=Planococcus citri TaxID=170843 RepID=UPI0031F7DEDE